MASDASPSSVAEEAEDARHKTGSSEMPVEVRKTGAISRSVLLCYLRAFGWPLLIAYALLLLLTFVTLAVADYCLSRWSEEARTSLTPDAVAAGVGATSAPSAADDWLRFYVALSLCHTGLLIFASISFALGCVRASRTLHYDTVRRLIYAPMHWYDTTPSGRTMSRFTSDLGAVDQQLSLELDNTCQFGTQFITLCLLVMVFARPAMTIITPIVVGVFSVMLLAVDRSNREVKRMANNAVSPMLTCLREIRLGAPLIRPMQFGDFFERRLDEFAGNWAWLTLTQKLLLCWGQHTGNHLTFFIALGASLSLIASRAGQSSVASAALAITNALLLPYFATFFTMIVTNARTQMACLERLLEFLSLPQEEADGKPFASMHSPLEHGGQQAACTGGANGKRALTSTRAPTVAADDTSWVDGGRIEFCDVCLRYRPGLPLVLHSFSAVIEARQKAAVVGRTGAGKSSLVLALFRLVEPVSGSITIDGHNALCMPLHQLRRAITIIPQDPVLHQGTVAHNLDPFGMFDSALLADVLQRAGLPSQMVREEVDKDGSNLSSGERQLLCFARALLHQRSLMVLDEATSNLDEETDRSIQRLLQREVFGKKTVLTIAHRLDTIIDYDQILVMGGGRLVESGSPAELMDAERGELRSMAAALGPEREAALLQRASSSKMGAAAPADLAVATRI